MTKKLRYEGCPVKDCQWLQQSHAHGLLRASHIAHEEYTELRTYIHERNVLQNQKKQHFKPHAQSAHSNEHKNYSVL